MSEGDVLLSSTIDYSTDAVNVLDKFYEVNFIVYVENDDDVVFWEKIFKLCNVNFSYVFKTCGGSKGVDKKIQDILCGELKEKIIAIRDADYLRLEDKILKHNRVLYTYGYSIENCLFNKITILELLTSNCRKNSQEKDFENIIEDLFEKIYTKLYDLWECDYISVTSKKSIEVMGKACEKFLESDKNKFEFSEEKIKNIVESFDKNSKACNVEISPEDFPRWIRGHFLHSICVVFIKKFGKINSLPMDNLLSQAFGLLEHNIFSDKNRKEYYEEICQKLLN